MASLEDKAKVLNEMLKTLGVTLVVKQVVEVQELPAQAEAPVVVAPTEDKKTLDDVLNPPAPSTDGPATTPTP